MTDDVYTTVKRHFATVNGVTVLSGSGAQGLKQGKKLFAMFTKGQVVVRLPPARVTQLIASDEGLPYDVGTGNPMKTWVLIPVTQKDSWIKHCDEARRLMGK